MKTKRESVEDVRSAIRFLRGWKVRMVIAMIAMVVLSGGMLASSVVAKNGGAIKWPAYHNGDLYSIFMGPGANSSNPNQFFNESCFDLGPDVSGAAAPKGLNIMYAVWYDGNPATQMFCVDGNGGPISGTQHDMILTEVPGGPGYSPKVQVENCAPGAGFSPPYTSEETVLAAKGDGEILCGLTDLILFANVVGGR